MKVRILEGDLLDQDVDVIVNAWNRNIIPWWLLLPQGVSKAIKRRAGYGPFRELGRAGPIPLGGAVITGAGRLPYQAIIHVAGISMLWRSSERSIRGSVRSAIALARERGFRSIAFPLIGAGTGGRSRERVQAWMLDELTQLEFDGEVQLVRLVAGRQDRPRRRQSVVRPLAGGGKAMKDDVLEEFDRAASDEWRFFFDPDHGYWFIAGSRIAVFADQQRWAVVFEKNGYANRGFNVGVQLDFFGNCLRNLDRCNAKYLKLFDYKDVCYDDDVPGHFEMLSPNKPRVSIRGVEVEVEHDPGVYTNHGIELAGDHPSIVELAYLLSEKCPELLWATESELRSSLPQDLPLLGFIHEWNHDPETLRGKLPSENEAYQLVAECIEKQSMDAWRPTLEPNNHYRNWPDAGLL